MLPGRPGEAPLLVSEHLAFDELRRNGPAVDGEEGALASPTQFVDRLRDDLLAGAARPSDEHAHRRSCDAGDLVIDLAHGLRPPVKGAEAPHIAHILLEVRDASGQFRRRRHPRQDVLEVPEVDGLDEVVARAEPQGLNGRIEARVTRDHHDFAPGKRLGLLGEQIHAAAVRQYEVEQNEVGFTKCDLLSCFGKRVCRRRSEAFVPDQLGQHLGGIGIVFNDERVWHGRCPCRCRRAVRRRTRRGEGGSTTIVPILPGECAAPPLFGAPVSCRLRRQGRLGCLNSDACAPASASRRDETHRGCRAPATWGENVIT